MIKIQKIVGLAALCFIQGEATLKPHELEEATQLIAQRAVTIGGLDFAIKIRQKNIRNLETALGTNYIDLLCMSGPSAHPNQSGNAARIPEHLKWLVEQNILNKSRRQNSLLQRISRIKDAIAELNNFRKSDENDVQKTVADVPASQWVELWHRIDLLVKIHQLQGGLMVFDGPMTDGKTSALYGVAVTTKQNNIPAQAFVSKKTRSHGGGYSRTGLDLDPLLIDENDSFATFNHFHPEIKWYLIDEGHFLTWQQGLELLDASLRGIRVVVGGLSLDYTGHSFDVMHLLSQSSRSSNVVCHVCGSAGASLHVRTESNPSESRANPGQENFAPSCRRCWPAQTYGQLPLVAIANDLREKFGSRDKIHLVSDGDLVSKANDQKVLKKVD